jgi:hypothetical protein
LPPSPGAATPASTLLRQRRSAQRFDRTATQPLESFLRMARALLRPEAAPEDAWRLPPQVHPVLFVHRVAGVEPGAYALIRDPSDTAQLRTRFADSCAWTRPAWCPEELRLVQLFAADSAAALRQICCGQELARACTFGVAFLADLQASVEQDPASYRRLHQEAGLLGHILYLEAEAEGFRGTGIGCFFDDLCVNLLRISPRFRPLYHFVVGLPITDPRLKSEPPYPAAQSLRPETVT